MTDLYPNFCMDESADQGKDEESKQLKLITARVDTDMEIGHFTEAYVETLISARKKSTQSG